MWYISLCAVCVSTAITNPSYSLFSLSTRIVGQSSTSQIKFYYIFFILYTYQILCHLPQWIQLKVKFELWRHSQSGLYFGQAHPPFPFRNRHMGRSCLILSRWLRITVNCFHTCVVIIITLSQKWCRGIILMKVLKKWNKAYRPIISYYQLSTKGKKDEWLGLDHNERQVCWPGYWH